jgi:hypothetical protein
MICAVPCSRVLCHLPHHLALSNLNSGLHLPFHSTHRLLVCTALHILIGLQARLELISQFMTMKSPNWTLLGLHLFTRSRLVNLAQIHHRQTFPLRPKSIMFSRRAFVLVSTMTNGKFYRILLLPKLMTCISGRMFSISAGN